MDWEKDIQEIGRMAEELAKAPNPDLRGMARLLLRIASLAVFVGDQAGKAKAAYKGLYNEAFIEVYENERQENGKPLPVNVVEAKAHDKVREAMEAYYRGEMAFNGLKLAVSSLRGALQALDMDKDVQEDLF